MLSPYHKRLFLSVVSPLRYRSLRRQKSVRSLQSISQTCANSLSPCSRHNRRIFRPLRPTTSTRTPKSHRIIRWTIAVTVSDNLELDPDTSEELPFRHIPSPLDRHKYNDDAVPDHLGTDFIDADSVFWVRPP
jgi:hypothetical protein